MASAAPHLLTPSQLDEWGEVVFMQPWHNLGDSADLKAPMINGRAIVLDLTEDDTWLQISVKPMKVHKGCEATVASIMLTIPDAWLDKLRKLDDRLMSKGLPSKDLKRDFSWHPMLHLAEGDDADEGTELHARLVLDNSAAPTILRFVTEAGVEKGTGLEFLQRCLGESRLEDFKCACRVELQFVDVEDLTACIPDELRDGFDESLHKGRAKSIFVKVHDALFVKPPKLSVVEFAPDRVLALVRAAKRMKVLP
jgi:hypothetical protein